MRKILSNIFLASLISLIVVNCANRGTPQGGPKDEDPPVIVKSEPDNFTTNFNEKEIKIYFDEYIKIKDIQKNLIISPPMDPMPEITPLGSASKHITIKIYDTLQINTTYAFNFGESITDNNEGNPYPFYKYVFSTGEYIDSLKVKGSVKDALDKKTEEFVTIMLYDVDSTFTDSIIYKEKPKYITNTLDSTNTFQLENLKEGKYLMVAIKDESSNYTFDQDEDKIGFLDDFITVSNDTTNVYELSLFKEETDFEVLRAKQQSENKIVFGIEGSNEDVEINMISSTPENFEYRILEDAKNDSDSLIYFYKPSIKNDSLLFTVSKKNKLDTLTVKIREREKDSLIIKASPRSSISFIEDFYIESNIPFTKIDESKIYFINKDSLDVTYSTKLDSLKNSYAFKFEKQEQETYKIQLFPGALEDFFGNNNDTLSYTLKTRTKGDYGDIRLTLQNAIYPVIVLLVDSKDEVKYEQFYQGASPIDFRHISPGKYSLRVIFDSNNNQKYDTGNYLLKRKPERVSYYPNIVEVRAGWDEIIEFTLLD
ncbi:MAG: Ig-like domain-containing protein [Bacteroidia bacterium]|nr:Ig-like domain-containing protein [Bacteroidia bacterium]